VRRQSTSPAADNSYPNPKILPSTFVAVLAVMAWGMVMARAVEVARAVLVLVALARVVRVALSLGVAVAVAVAIKWW
jgi:hypothetical protein